MSRPLLHLALAAAAAGLAWISISKLASAQIEANAGRLNAAQYASDGRLVFPANTDRWIALGSSIGGAYDDAPFGVEDLTSIGAVQMEPSAYDYFLEHRRYADGTMLLLTFYGVEEKPSPALRGFVQGAVRQREIHVIDKQRYPEEGQAFYVYPGESDAPATAFPVGSECVVCHKAEGQTDSTFTQFYPPLRKLLAE